MYTRRSAQDILDSIQAKRAEYDLLSRQLSERLAMETAFPILKGVGRIAPVYSGTACCIMRLRVCRHEWYAWREYAREVSFAINGPDGQPLVSGLTLLDVPDTLKPMVARHLNITFPKPTKPLDKKFGLQ